MANVNSNAREFTLTREFHAPKELLFKVCTEAQHLKNWWGPKGSILKADPGTIVEGSKFHYEFTYEGSPAMWGLLTFIEIAPHDRIVFTSSFADEKGNPVKPPFANEFPLHIKNTWTLTENNGKTTLHMKAVALNASQPEIDFFTGMFPSMEQGNAGMLDQLENYLRVRMQLYKQNKLSTMARTSTYLNFPGNTEEAFLFYKSIFGTNFNGDGIKRFGDLPAAKGQPPMSDEHKKLVIHVELPITGGHVLMATDAPESMGFKLTQGNNMHINLEPETKKETKRLFDALAKGGNVTMELQDMFWGSYFGTCTDKYGINWMFNCEEK